MISDIIANQQNIVEIEKISLLDTSNVNCSSSNEANAINDIIPLTKDTHDKIYNYLIDELKTYKKITNQKEQEISMLNNKIEELLLQLNNVEAKINKMNNINLLIKLKENLTNKQNDFSSEINNINNNSNNSNNCEEKKYNNDDTTMTLSEEYKPNNIVIDDAPSLKPKKKPTVFGRRF